MKRTSKSAADVVGCSSGKAASVHKFEEEELELLYEQFKLLRVICGSCSLARLARWN
jgi:hypothetical protein